MGRVSWVDGGILEGGRERGRESFRVGGDRVLVGSWGIGYFWGFCFSVGKYV